LISNHFRDSVGGPEKAGVGGSIPSLATNNFNNLAIAKNIQKSAREQYANIRQPTFAAFAHCGSRIFQSSRAVPLVRAICCFASFA
jgi:hypothetical protein